MSSLNKFACPSCGQNIEYTEVWSGKQIPCPACQQNLTIPGLPSGMTKSSLRLARDVPQPVHRPPSRLAALLFCLRHLINRKGVALPLTALLLLGGALLAASKAVPSLAALKAGYNPKPPLLAAVIDRDGSIPEDPPDPPPVDPSHSIPRDPQPAPAPSASTPTNTAPAPKKAPRGARAGRQPGRQGGARGNAAKKPKPPPAPNSANN